MSCVRRLWNERGALSHRLTRTYALLFAATTLCLSLCVYFVSRQYLIERQRDDLERSACNIAEVFQQEVAEGHDAADPAVLWELNSDENVALALIGPDGGAISHAAYFDLSLTEIPDCAQGSVLYRQADDLPLLAQGVAVTLDGGAPGTLAVIRRVDREYEFLEMLIGLLAALNIAGAVVALIAGRITAGRMLAPLSEMIYRAQAIDAHALDTRLALPPADDELRQLAQTLNAMLDRVQAAFVRQGQFTQDASHELRTPLAVLQGNAELLDRWGKGDPAVRDKCIFAIRRQVEYMNHLVESLLFLSRGDNRAQVLRPEEIDLPVFLAEIISDRREIDPRHEYSLRADPTLLRQLLLILLDNAAKYTPEGRGMHLSAAHCGTATRISLRDEGCGVPPDQLDRIFERFYRVDKARARATGGSGLGLAIARTIVSLHGGEIYAENAAEGGLRVTVKLPEG